MTPIEKIAAGLASDLAQEASIRAPQVQMLLREAFHRGLTLGLSIRDSRHLASDPTPPSPEPAPWTPMH